VDDRWHRRPTALLGGVAIALVSLGAVLTIRPYAPLWVHVLTGTLMFGVGFTDDLIPLKPSTKLTAQFILASAVVFFGHRLHWFESSQTLDALITIAWIVGITNAVNLLDNMDGLCAGVTLISGCTILLGLASAESAGPLAAYLAAVLGATAGFLVYNVNPASIFMGDSGSLFLGFTLATMSVELPSHSRATSLLSSFAAPVLVMLIPIFDTAFVTVSRRLSRRRASQGGRDHASHRLVAVGLPERSAVLVLWMLAGAGAGAGYTLEYISTDWGLLTLVLLLVSLGLFAVFLSRVRVYEGEDLSLLRSGRVTPFVVNLVITRRVGEVLLDVCLVTVAYYSAYRLRFTHEEFQREFLAFFTSLPLVLAIQMATLFVVGAYRGVWRYFGLMDGVVFGKSVGLGTLSIAFLLVCLYRFESYSRAVLIIYAAILMLLLTGSRASMRLMAEFVKRRRGGDRAVIYGAGDAGTMVVREQMQGQRQPLRLLGFIDDDSRKHRTRVQGYPVLGGMASLEALITNNAVDQVIVSTRLIDAVRWRRLQDLCKAHDVQLFRLHFDLELVTSA
jgi:UDP-GlcNAc:undecaprenyl-phosphate GlcNAc-1-phosphate transferase